MQATILERAAKQPLLSKTMLTTLNKREEAKRATSSLVSANELADDELDEFAANFHAQLDLNEKIATPQTQLSLWAPQAQ
jgi:hypothetical protein